MCIRDSVGNPDVCIPANSKGKLDVAGAVGVGFMNVIKDLSLIHISEPAL